MEKRCTCGKTMQIRLRTVIFSGKVKIENVPVYSCTSCERSIVYPEVKPELTGLLRSLGGEPERQQLFFNEINELAHLLYEVTKKEKSGFSVEQIIGERINELLDLLLLAQSLQDEEWADSIRMRLSQITNGQFATYLS
ncbi:hypothetical protein [Paenibacillus alkalitolerans]|uniref:hypothetical protein n=1 Tax=Paenibacillus alkalitolerans TaxID=2799335 RepID=UPI0018F685C6|nr:hypothetical protein [Paenibacillus alkalitolerans]